MRWLITATAPLCLAIMPLSLSALAQVDPRDKASGPTLRDFWGDLSAWGASHPGVVVAFAIAAATMVGIAIFNRAKR